MMFLALMPLVHSQVLDSALCEHPYAMEAKGEEIFLSLAKNEIVVSALLGNAFDSKSLLRVFRRLLMS